MRTVRIVQASLLLILLQSCSGQDAPAEGEQETAVVTADMLLFEESEPGLEPYPVRILVSPDHVRIDDNLDAGNYILYERGSTTIYSVTHEDGTILEITSEPAAEVSPPQDLVLDEEMTVAEDAPAVSGITPVHYRIRANGTVCYDLVQLPGLLDKAGVGLAEYYRALGNRQAAALGNLPPDQRTPCYMARYVFAADRPYLGGIPVEQWDAEGNRRSLVNYRRQAKTDSSLFRLPAGYQHYEPPATGP